MKSIAIKIGKVVTANSNHDIIKDCVLIISNNLIQEIYSLNEFENLHFDGEIFDFTNKIAIPGFVQTHVHLCQTLFRGLADDLELLDWLQKRIFPYENAHTYKSLKASAALGIYELQKSGTTTILDMGTIHNQEAVFDQLAYSGMRAISGKCMVDQNSLFPEFKESTSAAINSSVELAKEYHGSNNGLLKYGFAPRFVLSCSENLLRDAFSLLDDFSGSIYHTHSSENKSEIETVRKMTGMENVEYFESLGVLGNKSVLAHCIHLNEKEIEILKSTGTRVSHCPSSNLKLGSGIANIPEYLGEGISVSLGNDGPPCNNSLSIFREMRLAALIQKPFHGPTEMDAETVFHLATIEGAKALNLQEEIGSIEIGKKADISFLNLELPGQCLLPNNENIYSNIVYSATQMNITDVMIDGKWKVKDGVSEIYSPLEIFSEGQRELKMLLNRSEG